MTLWVMPWWYCGRGGSGLTLSTADVSQRVSHISHLTPPTSVHRYTHQRQPQHHTKYHSTQHLKNLHNQNILESLNHESCRSLRRHSLHRERIRPIHASLCLYQEIWQYSFHGYGEDLHHGESSSVKLVEYSQIVLINDQQPSHNFPIRTWTFFLIQIKPDGVQRGIVGNIVSRFETKGYKLAAMKTKMASQELLDQHYKG